MLKCPFKKTRRWGPLVHADFKITFLNWRFWNLILFYDQVWMNYTLKFIRPAAFLANLYKVNSDFLSSFVSFVFIVPNSTLTRVLVSHDARYCFLPSSYLSHRNRYKCFTTSLVKLFFLFLSYSWIYLEKKLDLCVSVSHLAVLQTWFNVI